MYNNHGIKCCFDDEFVMVLLAGEWHCILYAMTRYINNDCNIVTKHTGNLNKKNIKAICINFVINFVETQLTLVNIMGTYNIMSHHIIDYSW